jgi:hypothetical protein
MAEHPYNWENLKRRIPVSWADANDLVLDDCRPVRMNAALIEASDDLVY